MSAANHWTPKLFPQSLRWRLSAVIALVAAVLAVALSLLVRTEFSRVQLADARRVQDERIQLVVRDYGLTGRAALGSRLDAPDVPRELLAAARGGRRATYLQRTANGAWIWAAAETDGHLLSLRSPYTDRDDALRQLDNALILGSAGVLVLASVLGVVLGARLSRRLRRAAVAARRVAEGDASLSVGEEIGTRPRDETAELAQAVDAVAAALRGRLAAEERVRDRVGVLRSLVEDILEVARLDTATEQAELVAVPLGDFVSRRVPVAVVEEAETVRTDPRRLERVLVNLLENAERHGSPPVTVHVVGRTIVVRDHGPGFPADLLREGPSRFRTADPNRSDGHGLGLTIAVAQARVLSAELTLANAADGGAEVTVALPSAP